MPRKPRSSQGDGSAGRITPFEDSGRATQSRLRSQAEFTIKQFTIVVKPFRAEAVLKEIAAMGITACVVREAKGYSRQKGYLERYAGSEYSLAFLPKVEITVWLETNVAREVGDRIVSIARTGRIGDGKVFVVPTAWPGVLEF